MICITPAPPVLYMTVDDFGSKKSNKPAWGFYRDTAKSKLIVAALRAAKQ